jgi:hypothetical protein
MSKRSPFWQPFKTRTPLGYSVAGYFNTEPGPSFGSIRFTHVDGPLPRPFASPGLPVYRNVVDAQGRVDLHLDADLVDLRALERPDGTMIAFYPLFDAEGALVEVVPRTAHSVVVADTAWKPLATLVRQAMHAGIEEAVRRQRGVFVFTLAGAANRRLISYPYRLRLVLTSVLRGSTGKVLASYAQMRAWSHHYGLDIPATCVEFDPHQPLEHTEAQVVENLAIIATGARTLPPGQLVSTGMLIWASERGNCAVLDLPARLQAAGAVNPLEIWETMATLADQGLAPSRERVAATVNAAGTLSPEAQIAWEEWAHAYPEAFEERRVPIAV